MIFKLVYLCALCVYVCVLGRGEREGERRERGEGKGEGEKGGKKKEGTEGGKERGEGRREEGREKEEGEREEGRRKGEWGGGEYYILRVYKSRERRKGENSCREFTKCLQFLEDEYLL